MVQKLTENWCKDEEAVAELDIIDTHYKSGKGTVECGNAFTVDWVRKQVSEIAFRVLGPEGEQIGPDKFFQALTSEEMKKQAFQYANVFLDNRFPLLEPLQPIVGALRRLNLDSESVSVVKTFSTKSNDQVRGRVVKLVMNNDLARSIKEFQGKNECLRAGFGYIKFDFARNQKETAKVALSDTDVAGQTVATEEMDQSTPAEAESGK